MSLSGGKTRSSRRAGSSGRSGAGNGELAHCRRRAAATLAPDRWPWATNRARLSNGSGADAGRVCQRRTGSRDKWNSRPRAPSATSAANLLMVAPSTSWPRPAPVRLAALVRRNVCVRRPAHSDIKCRRPQWGPSAFRRTGYRPRHGHFLGHSEWVLRAVRVLAQVEEKEPDNKHWGHWFG